jgi:hypothetical protein
MLRVRIVAAAAVAVVLAIGMMPVAAQGASWWARRDATD